ncbi:MAG: GNAT family N-acetyltransferase [Microgenomates group bacterium]
MLIKKFEENDLPSLKKLVDDDFYQNFLHLLRDANTLIFCCLNNDRDVIGVIVGMYYESLDRRIISRIEGLFVQQQLRRKRIGSQLIQFLEKEFIKLEVKEVFVQKGKIDDNISELFYLTNGYKKIKQPGMFNKVL